MFILGTMYNHSSNIFVIIGCIVLSYWMAMGDEHTTFSLSTLSNIIQLHINSRPIKLELYVLHALLEVVSIHCDDLHGMRMHANVVFICFKNKLY